MFSKRDDAEPGVGDQLRDRAVEVAAAADPSLDRGEPVLPGGDLRIGRESVLEEVQSATRPQHSAELAQGAGDVGDGAERERADGGVGGVIVERQVLTVEADELDGHAACRGTRLGEASSDRRRFDGEDPVDLGRVVGEVVAGSEPDLDDVARQPGQRAAAWLGEVTPCARLVDDAWQHVVAPDRHH